MLDLEGMKRRVARVPYAPYSITRFGLKIQAETLEAARFMDKKGMKLRAERARAELAKLEAEYA